MLKYLNIIIGILIVAILFVGYRAFTSEPFVEEGGLESVGVSSDGVAVGVDASAQFADLLLRINTIKLDRRVFEHPLFSTLTDYSRDLGTEPQGRPNPFAPVGAGAPRVSQRAATQAPTTNSQQAAVAAPASSLQPPDSSLQPPDDTLPPPDFFDEGL